MIHVCYCLTNPIQCWSRSMPNVIRHCQGLWCDRASLGQNELNETAVWIPYIMYCSSVLYEVCPATISLASSMVCGWWTAIGWFSLGLEFITNEYAWLTHWGRVTHICVGNLTIIGSDNGLSPDRRQTIIWTNVGILLNGPLGTNFSEILIKLLWHFLSRKCVRKCCLENGGHLVSASMC